MLALHKNCIIAVIIIYRRVYVVNLLYVLTALI
jgi:hypothetical protein